MSLRAHNGNKVTRHSGVRTVKDRSKMMGMTMQKTLGLCIALCLGLTSACVKVDVTVTSSDTSRLDKWQSLPNKPSISIEKLEELHASRPGKRPVCPPDRSLPINHEKQQTIAWCWAASSRTVMEYRNKKKIQPEPTAPQCDIVKNVFGLRLGGANCCERKNSPDSIDTPWTCVRGGWPHWVLDNYQFDYEWVDGRFDNWDVLKTEICNDYPFISVIEWSGGGKHTLVVTGYRESPASAGLQRVVEIEDPNEDDNPQDLTFDEFVRGSAKKPGWSYEFSHDRTYVQIVPISTGKP